MSKYHVSDAGSIPAASTGLSGTVRQRKRCSLRQPGEPVGRVRWGRTGFDGSGKAHARKAAGDYRVLQEERGLIVNTWPGGLPSKRTLRLPFRIETAQTTNADPYGEALPMAA